MVMKDGFRELVRQKEALATFLNAVEPNTGSVSVELRESYGRIASETVISPRPSPHYPRAAMDGYAVIASDTYGASVNSPVRLTIVEDCPDQLGGEASPIHTGGAVPDVTDAVVKFEDTEEKSKYIDVYRPVAPGDNVSPVGEDVEKGDVLIEPGEKVTSPYLGLFQSLGVEEIQVAKKPEVAIVPTGEELVPPGDRPGPGQTVQSNGIMIEKFVQDWGGVPEVKSVLSDQPDRLAKGLEWGLEYDVVVFTGGSSVGRRDRIVEVISGRGEVLVHGVAIQPGKPVALGIVDDTPVIALPGYPVATLVDAYFFLRPLIYHLLGYAGHERTGSVELGKKIPSTLGKMSVVRVDIKDGLGYPIRVSGSGVLSSVTRSIGFVMVPEDSEGFPKGKTVELFYWR